MSDAAIMDELYGRDYADQVRQRLNELDPEFSKIVYQVAYDQFWSKPELNIREKSLITIAALVSQGKEEQTKIHMRGFLKSGGSLKELRAVLIHLIVYCGFPAVMNAFAHLKTVIDEGGVSR